MPRPLLLVSLCAALLAAPGATVAAADADTDGAALAAGLAADDVCTAGQTQGECSLELRQLRLQAKAQELGEQQEDEDEDDDEDGAEVAAALLAGRSARFGVDVEGEDMWTETTWNDMVDLLQGNASEEGRGWCEQQTGGTCSVFGCADSRGPTDCTNSKCLCRRGFCNKEGTCYPLTYQACARETGGTCSDGYGGGCSWWRGQTKCESSKCLCKTGGCAWKGKCYAVTDTGAKCAYNACAMSRGSTTCHKGRCLCKWGFVAVNGRCKSYFGK